MPITDDPYFTLGHLEANESVEGGIATTFAFDGPEGRVDHAFILRPIPGRGAREDLYDIISPYGFGGPRLFPAPGADPAALVAAFGSRFAEFCESRGIVSEFVRFHPFETQAELFAGIYDVDLLRPTVYTDLTGEGVFEREFSKTARRRFRRNARSGVTTRIVEKPRSLEEFKRVYRMTMDRNDANAFYRFEDEYFEALTTKMSDQVVVAEARYEGTTIAAELCLVGAGRIHSHLQGTDSRFRDMSPAYSLAGAILEWGIEKNMTLIHHGGGLTNSREDPLYLHKRSFGTGEADFYVGRRVWIPEHYEELCAAHGVDPSDTSFFPAYRRERCPDFQSEA
ncbi:MAG TPA: GNAT family N-acetyltransferase [Actinomycetaceae bacterium]|nr:GNAT family N-acetyltransferase [Actinomycetaceae bacterium]